MKDIQGIPFAEARFDKSGGLLNDVSVADTTTDLFVISHGWRNSYEEATDLYTQFFTNFADHGTVAPDLLAGRHCGIVGVFWPGANFDFLLAAQDTAHAANAAVAGTAPSDPESQQRVIAQLERMKSWPLFDDPAEQAALKIAQDTVPDLDGKHTARAAFVDALRSLMGPRADNKEDASNIFLTMEPDMIFSRLNLPPHTVDPAVPRTGKAMALTPGAPAGPGAGHTTGLLDIFKGATASASNVASYLTYYMMKARAGDVGARGLAPLLDKLAARTSRLHLIGHSFGGRLVTAAAMASTTDRLQSMSLLQAAFSHNGFSPTNLMDGFFRPVVAKGRVRGVTISTHTKNDTAVGVAYPLASRLAGTVASMLGDEKDKFGGLGRNGAQQMNLGEVVVAKLLAVGQTYTYTSKKIHNLLADDFIQSHGDVTRKEVVSAVAQAAFQAV